MINKSRQNQCNSGLWKAHPFMSDVVINCETAKCLRRHLVTCQQFDVKCWNRRIQDFHTYLVNIDHYCQHCDHQQVKYELYTDAIFPLLQQHWIEVESSMAIIKGFRRLSTTYGLFRICRDMISMNEQYQIKVWVNPNPALSSVWRKTDCEQIMTSDLIKIILENDKIIGKEIIGCHTLNQIMNKILINLPKSQMQGYISSHINQPNIENCEQTKNVFRQTKETNNSSTILHHQAHNPKNSKMKFSNCLNFQKINKNPQNNSKIFNNPQLNSLSKQKYSLYNLSHEKNIVTSSKNIRYGSVVKDIIEGKKSVKIKKQEQLSRDNKFYKFESKNLIKKEEKRRNSNLRDEQFLVRSKTIKNLTFNFNRIQQNLLPFAQLGQKGDRKQTQIFHENDSHMLQWRDTRKKHKDNNLFFKQFNIIEKQEKCFNKERGKEDDDMDVKNKKNVFEQKKAAKANLILQLKGELGGMLQVTQQTINDPVRQKVQKKRKNFAQLKNQAYKLLSN